jgi:hypothetical protein
VCRGTGVGVALPELCKELCRDTSTLEDRAIAWIRRSVFGFARGGVDGACADPSDEIADTADDEREWADVGIEVGVGRDVAFGKAARFLADPLRAPRPLTAAPSLIHPSSFSSRATRFLSFCGDAGGDCGRGVSCEARRPKSRRLGVSVRAPSSLSLSSRRTARRFVSVRVFHFSVPPGWLPIWLPPRNSPAMLLKNPPLPLRERSGALCDVDDVGWLNDPVPVPVPLLVVLLPSVS